MSAALLGLELDTGITAIPTVWFLPLRHHIVRG